MDDDTRDEMLVSIVEQQRQRYYRDDPVRWVWILYGLTQAVVTMLLAFDVIHEITVSAVTTAVALIVYVGVNEILVRPYRTKPARPSSSGSGVAEHEHRHDEHGETDE